MKNMFKAFLFLAISVSLLSGCKLDPPIYPDGGTIYASGGTITYTINGSTTIYTQNVAYTTASDGSLSIGGGQTTNDFGLGVTALAAGTYSLNLIVIKDMIGKTGSVTFTTYKTPNSKQGTITGLFTAQLIQPNSDNVTNVTGTFNINR